MFDIKYDRDGQPIRNQEPLMAPAEPEPVVQEAAPQEEPEVQEQEEPVVEQEAAAPKEVFKESDAAKNFREMREAKSRAERERDDYMRRLAELEARANAKPLAQIVEEDEELRLGNDDLAEGKHLAIVNKEVKKLRQELKQYKAQTAEQTTEAQLKSKYADFDKVVSRDNIDALTAAYPELARSLQATDDLYTKAVSAYTLIKKFGIYQESPFSSEKALAIKNTAKPRPLTSVSPQQGESALSRANAFASGLTDDLKAQLRREMEDARKAY